MTDRIKKEIIKKRDYLAEEKVLERTSCPCARLAFLKQKIAMLDGWMILLSTDEAYVVKLRLIDGIDWGRITDDYCKIWGAAYGKTEQTLRRYLKTALLHIEAFMIKHDDMVALMMDE